MARSKQVRAGSIPPITSTTTSTAGSAAAAGGAPHDLLPHRAAPEQADADNALAHGRVPGVVLPATGEGQNPALLLHEGDEAAEGRLPALEAEGEGADPDAL